MIETIIIALIACKIKGYNIKPLFGTFAIYPVIILEIVYFAGQAMLLSGNYEVVKYMTMLKSIYICSYIFLIIKYELYSGAIIGSICMFIGGALNDIAIKVNNGFMPVFPSLSYLTGHTKIETFNLVSNSHVLGTSETNLKILTDFIDIGYCVLSIGDLFIRVFVFIIIYYSVKKINIESEEKVEC